RRKGFGFKLMTSQPIPPLPTSRPRGATRLTLPTRSWIRCGLRICAGSLGVSRMLQQLTTVAPQRTGAERFSVMSHWSYNIALRRGLQKKPLQRTAALLCRRTVRENWLATVAADRAFLVAVAELGR